MSDIAPIVVVGPPGAGKTTVGALLAATLGLAFFDNDASIEAAAGKPISEIFIDEGEPVFRRLEAESIARALVESQGVISLGGGAVLDESTRALLRAHRVLYLRVGLSDAVRRVGIAQSRPVLTLNPRAALRELLAKRTPLYEEVATVTIDTDGLTPEEVAATAATELTRLGGSQLDQASEANK